MKKSLFFSIIGFTAFGILVYGYFSATPGLKGQTSDSPVIGTDSDSFDFGEITYGDIVEHTFSVKNSGNDILEIKRLSTSCSCTTAIIDSDKILPDKEAKLTVSYNTGAMSGPHGMGEQERIIYIKTNDPLNPQAEITIYATVK